MGGTTTIRLQPADDSYKIIAVTSGAPSSGTNDPDLDAIAALDATQSGVIASDGSGWIRKTYPQLKTSLSITKADLTLGNVDNTSDALKPISDATQTALNGKQAAAPNLTSLAGIDATTAGAIANDGAGWIKKTYTQLKTALVLVKADVGLGNVDNTSDVNKPVSTAQQAALDAKVDKGSASWLIEQAVSQSFQINGAPTYDATYGTLTASNIKWPDGTTGAYAPTSLDSNGAPLGFTATYVGAITRTVTVMIPRNGSSQVSGAVTAVVS